MDTLSETARHLSARLRSILTASSRGPSSQLVRATAQRKNGQLATEHFQFSIGEDTVVI